MALVIIPLYQCHLLKYSWPYVQNIRQTEQPLTGTSSMTGSKVEVVTTSNDMRPMEANLEHLQELRQIMRKNIQFWIEYFEIQKK